MSDLQVYSVGAVALLLLWGVWQKRRRNAAEALNLNLNEKKVLVSLDQQKHVDDGETERRAIEEYVREKEKEALTDEDLKNFFNNTDPHHNHD